MAKGLRQSLAPIALFAYRRPDHLAKTVAALRANQEAKESILYVFSDAAKDVASAKDVDAVRAELQNIGGFAQVHLIFHEQNLGLAENITRGVSAVLSQHDSVIVVEDDVVVSAYFLLFMNEALALYADEKRVGSISGYCYPLSGVSAETFFIRGADCWGWATWRDRWRYYNPDGRTLLAELTERNLEQSFDFDGAMGYTQMLKDQIEGKNDSWAVRWHASCFLRDLLILYPGRTLVCNIGNDGSGTHATMSDESYTSALSARPIVLARIPIEQNATARAAILDFFKASQEPSCATPESKELSSSGFLLRLTRKFFGSGERDLQ